jgi:hypothetical protein
MKGEMKSLLAVVIAAVTLSACGQAQTVQQDPHVQRDVAALQAQAKSCLASTKTGHGWLKRMVNCAAPAGRQAQAQACAKSNLKIVFTHAAAAKMAYRFADCVVKAK